MSLSAQHGFGSAISSSSNQKRHDGKHAKHHIVDRSRHRISAGKVLPNRHAPKPEHKRKFRDQQEAERDAAHTKSGRQRGRHSETPNCPPRCEYGDHEHDRRFHQFGHSHPESRDNPQCANGSKHEARSEYEREIEHASFQNRHNIFAVSQCAAHCRYAAKGYEDYHWT